MNGFVSKETAEKLSGKLFRNGDFRIIFFQEVDSSFQQPYIEKVHENRICCKIGRASCRERVFRAV